MSESSHLDTGRRAQAGAFGAGAVLIGVLAAASGIAGQMNSSLALAATLAAPATGALVRIGIRARRGRHTAGEAPLGLAVAAVALALAAISTQPLALWCALALAGAGAGAALGRRPNQAAVIAGGGAAALASAVASATGTGLIALSVLVYATALASAIATPGHGVDVRRAPLAQGGLVLMPIVWAGAAGATMLLMTGPRAGTAGETRLLLAIALLSAAAAPWALEALGARETDAAIRRTGALAATILLAMAAASNVGTPTWTGPLLLLALVVAAGVSSPTRAARGRLVVMILIGSAAGAVATETLGATLGLSLLAGTALLSWAGSSATGAPTSGAARREAPGVRAALSEATAAKEDAPDAR